MEKREEEKSEVDRKGEEMRGGEKRIKDREKIHGNETHKKRQEQT